jgi:hypothetical protein
VTCSLPVETVRLAIVFATRKAELLPLSDREPAPLVKRQVNCSMAAPRPLAIRRFDRA